MDTYLNKYLNESYRKECRKYLVNSIYNFLRKTKYPKNYLAFMIKSWHYTFPYMTMFVFLFAPLWMGCILTFVLFMFTILYIYLKGCFVSHLEYKLCKKNFINIIDPYLITMNYPINNETRYTGTLIVVLMYFGVVISILYNRIFK